MNRGALLVRIFIILSIVTLLSSSCGDGGCSRFFSSKKGKGVPVMIEQVKVKETSPVETVIGKLVPSNKADVALDHEAKIQDVYVKVGLTVTAGEPLFRLSEEEINNDLNVARARRTEVEALLEKNTNLLRSREQLLEEGKIDQDEISRLEKEIAAEEAELERVKAEIVKLSYNLDHVVVNSPISGMVIKSDIVSGSLTKPGEVLVKIVDVNPILVSFALDASQSKDIVVDTPLSIFINEMPEETYTAKVTYINPELHRVGKTFQVWAALPNDDLTFKAGMSASTEFVSDTSKHSFIIPLSAVLSRTSSPYIYKVSRGVAHRTPITIGSVFNSSVEVVRGLEKGDIVVVRGAGDLYDGADVNVWR